MILYSLSLIGGYALAKWVTPRFPSLRTRRFHLHHWMWSAAILLLALWQGWAVPDWVVGAVTGICLQGLSYRNWGFLRERQG